MDRIVVSALPVSVRVGVSEEERAAAQGLTIDVELRLDLGPAGRSDDFAATVDYVAVCEAVVEVATEREFRLIEALAERTARVLLERFPADEVVVSVKKPSALHRFGAPHATVELRRGRNG